jgi:hypothetical protein
VFYDRIQMIVPLTREATRSCMLNRKMPAYGQEQDERRRRRRASETDDERDRRRARQTTSQRILVSGDLFSDAWLRSQFDDEKDVVSTLRRESTEKFQKLCRLSTGRAPRTLPASHFRIAKQANIMTSLSVSHMMQTMNGYPVDMRAPAWLSRLMRD